MDGSYSGNIVHLKGYAGKPYPKMCLRSALFPVPCFLSKQF
jgi:hypothetical protein